MMGKSHYNHMKDISGSQAIKIVIIIQNAYKPYKNPAVLSRTHEDIERMIALLVLTQSLYYL